MCIRDRKKAFSVRTEARYRKEQTRVEKRENIEIALKKIGIESEAQLKEAIRKMKPINISTMTAPVVSERKVG